MLPPILLKDEASLLESPPPMGAGGADDQRTVEAPAGYARQVAEMDARAVQDARDEEITKLLRRMLRLERAFCAVMPSLLLIPGLPEQRRKVLAQAIQLLRKALEEKSPPKAGAGRAPGATRGGRLAEESRETKAQRGLRKTAGVKEGACNRG